MFKSAILAWLHTVQSPAMNRSFGSFPPSSSPDIRHNMNIPITGTSSTTHSDSVSPNIDDLHRIGSQKQCYAWSKSCDVAFYNWWQGTSFYQRYRHERLSTGINIFNTRNRTSELWLEFYQAAEITSGNPVLVCKTCAECIQHPGVKTSGTNSMKNHKRSDRCRKAGRRSTRGLEQTTLSVLGDSDDTSRIRGAIQIKSQNRPADIQDQLLRMMTSLQLPFRAVENEQFRKFVQLLSDDFRLPSTKTVRGRVLDRCAAIQNELMAGLGDHTNASLAVDCWSSPTKLSFLGVTAYFIDDQWHYRESLIGFEHIEGAHTGLELASTLKRVIDRNGLADRILSITTDNASNNNTMFTELLHDTDLLDTHSIECDHLPCLAHIIQLVVSELLGRIRITPSNEEIQHNWTDGEDHELRTKSGIALALGKIRKLGILINAGSQRRVAFRMVQVRLDMKPIKLLLQDVKSRWNSTCEMLLRAEQLRGAIDLWLRAHHLFDHLALSVEEWKMVGYLIDLIKPFAYSISLIGATKGPTIYQVYPLYENLFNHLEQAEARLRRKTTPWKRSVLEALLNSREKLKKYYSKTYGSSGSLYGIATILAPYHKVSLFDSENWTNGLNGETDWKERYIEALQDRYDKYYTNVRPGLQRPRYETLVGLSEMDKFLHQSRRRKFLIRDDESEIGRYLAEPPTELCNVLEYWKRREFDLPGLAAMARDILAIPAAGVGVERIFNSARDICHYRRGRLQPESIQALILTKIYDRIQLQDELTAKHDLINLEDDTSAEDLEEQLAIDLEERKKELDKALEMNYISDDDEQGYESGEDITIVAGTQSMVPKETAKAEDLARARRGRRKATESSQCERQAKRPRVSGPFQDIYNIPIDDED